MKKKSSATLLGAVIIILIAAGGYYAYYKYSKPKNIDNVKYVKSTVEKSSVSVVVQATGTVFTPVSKDIVSPDSGPITLNYKLGDTVKKGDIIGKISDDDLQLQIKKDQISIQMLNLDLAQIIPANTTGIQQKQLAIQQVQADLAAKQAELNRTSIASPVSGTIIAQNYDSGDIVQNGKAIVTVADLAQLQLDVSVDELDIAQVKPGQKVDVQFDALPGKKFDGQVVKISDIGKTTNNVTNYDVFVSINNPAGVKVGMNSNVNIQVDNKENVLVLPLEAVQRKNEKSFVYVPAESGASTEKSNTKASKKNKKVPGDNVELKQIQVGLSNDSVVEVAGGLSEGQEVLIPVPQTDTDTSSSNSKGINSLFGKQANKVNKTKGK